MVIMASFVFPNEGPQHSMRSEPPEGLRAIKTLYSYSQTPGPLTTRDPCVPTCCDVLAGNFWPSQRVLVVLTGERARCFNIETQLCISHYFLSINCDKLSF